MKLSDIQTAIQFKLWVIPLIDGSELTDGLVQFEASSTSEEYNIIQAEKLIQVRLRNEHQRNDINFHIKRGCAKLAHIIQIAKDGAALLKINFFNGSLIEMGEIEIGINEWIKTTAKRKGLEFQDTKDLASLLSNKTLIEKDDSDSVFYFLIMTGGATDEDFDLVNNESDATDTERNAASIGNSQSVERQLRCFSIYGDALRIPVEKRQIDKNTEIFFATSLISKLNSNAEGSLRLAKGKIIFSDYTKTGQIRALAAGSMSRLYQEKGSYLKKWDEYGAIEGELLLSHAKSIGKLEYNKYEISNKGVKFFFQKRLPSNLSEGDQLEFTEKEPLYIRNPDLTWEQYSNHLEKEFITAQGYSKDTDISDNTCFAKIVQIETTSLVLDLPIQPSDGKFLVLSINGDTVQIERRMKARKLILEGRSANPLLGLLIEEGGVIPDIQRVKKLKPLTSFVREKIFIYDPTDAQVKAIEMALNTPDIALIQGPPGTGKTTVITAILERLNEEHDKTRTIRGEILVSGFQHDAVENIVSRLSVNSLPAVKFGKRSSDSEFKEDTVSKKREGWCQGVADRIRAMNPQIVPTEDQRKLADLFNLYAISPSLSNAINLLNRILSIPRYLLTPQLVEQTELLLDSLKSETHLGQSLNEDLLKTVRSLRISEAGYRDDGKERVADILAHFEDILEESKKRTLKKALAWKEGCELSFLNDLRGIKLKLLEIYTSRPQYRIEKPREDMLGLIAQVSMQLEKHKTSNNQESAILANFLHELEDNPDGVREAVEDYNYVFAATTQQAEGTAIRKAKTKYNDDFVKYDTIIIDEAARTSPRDMLIPMTQAEKRIILVGDHRQLPHIINEDIVKELTSEDNINIKPELDYVRQSMFEYLFHRLQKLEQKDGICRTVTLDAQFRMHPVLGKFVSDNFYKKHREGFRSPLPETLFTHQLEDTEGKAAAWLNVPNKTGKEKKQGTSRCRLAEAEAIAERLKTWIDSEDGKNLTFGVISFYKAQEYTIREALKKHGITKKAQNGSLDIAEDYKFLKREEDGKTKIEERLRIGTVDAFQGMEFDVVFLSMVRSKGTERLPSPLKMEKIELEKAKRSIFGHLISENRLCVSMSRQKKLLILVGDSELARTEIAREAVPALGNYFELCSQEGVIL